MNRRFVLASVFLALMALVLQGALAQTRKPHGPDASEIALLPVYCQAKFSKDRNTQRLWAQRMGEGWIDLHHYCYGLNFINRANMEFQKSERTFNLVQARAEFDYVLRNWSANYPLRAEAESNKAMVEMLLR